MTCYNHVMTQNPDTTAVNDLPERLREEADTMLSRPLITHGQRLVVADVMIQAADALAALQAVQTHWQGEPGETW